MIKAIIFDIGGVLVRTEDHGFRREWERKLGLEKWESEQIVFSSDMGTKAQAGAITDEELWTWVGKALALDADRLADFRRDFWAGDALDEDLVSYIRSLRTTYQTAVISNATDNLRYSLTHIYPIADAFDLIVGSAEEGIMKPEKEIYLRTLERLDRAPDEAVFIDDSAPNVRAARNLGMHAIHYEAGMDVPDALRGLGVRQDRKLNSDK